MKRLVAALLGAAAMTQGASSEENLARVRGFVLEATLKEVSGMTPAGADSVFAHDDEFAIIHEINLESGVILRSFAFGKPTATGDFEAAALMGDAILLMRSDGRLFEGEIREHGKRTRFNIYDTGVSDKCEVEGMAASGVADEIYILCKNVLKADKPTLRLYRWSLANRLKSAKKAIDAPLTDYVSAADAETFRPSELVRDPASGDFLVLNASGGILRVKANGAMAGYTRLDRAHHPQPEGLAVTADGRIVIGDEGAKRAGTITVYERR